MAFICALCNITSGDTFLRGILSQAEPSATFTPPGPRTAVYCPDWCVSDSHDFCRQPPPEVARL